jgi:tetratricopeptide (TPR) repeat protein
MATNPQIETRTLSDADIEARVAKARSAVQSGDLNAAIALAQEVLDAAPTDQDALYTLAVAYRLGRQLAQALATISDLIAAFPTYGRAYQERGHALRDAGRIEEALAAYQAAVTHNNALLASWRMLNMLNTKAGHAEAARFAQAQCAYLDSLPPELQSVASLIQEGRLLKAETLCRSFLQTHKHHPEGMRLLAELGVKFNSFDEAEFLLESCVVLEPENTNAHYDYVNILHKRQKFAAALQQATVLRQKMPHKPQFELLYANENLAVGNFDEALAIYRQQLTATPHNASLHLSLGHALKTVGQQVEAISAYTEAYRVRPDFGDAYWSLANLKTYRFEDDVIQKMRAMEAATTTDLVDRYHLCFALGKALEDKAGFAESFEYYERGNRLKREEVGYDWRKLHAEMQLQIEHCTPALFAHHAGAGDPAADPIFIVGLPRAGSTLLEQILASHSQVEGTMELPDILSLAHKLDGRRRIDEEARYPRNLAETETPEFAKFGAAYIRDTLIQRKQGKPFFIDKMPNNFRHIGLIHLILPNAKIIDARRGAMGCCFSGFKQLFAEGQEFTYGLEEIGHYYRDYVALMDHWDAVLPGKVLRVRYEDVVSDTETQVRRLLDFCGLPFEEACVNFHQTERAVRTASSEQVRQPIFKSGLDQWEHYAPYLDPLRDILGPELA